MSEIFLVLLFVIQKVLRWIFSEVTDQRKVSEFWKWQCLLFLLYCITAEDARNCKRLITINCDLNS